MPSIHGAHADPSKRRITGVMLLCALTASTVIGRAAYVQLGHDPRLEQLSRRQFQSRFLVRPRRGNILDRNGEALAVNVEIKSLAANPSKVTNKKTLARLISRATDLPYSKVLQKLGEKREFVWIKRHVPDGELDHFKKWQLIGPDGDLVPGLWLVKESKRVYPHNELAAHVLGDVNLDSEGLEGVELWQNEKLRGKVISVSAVKDALGRPTFLDAVAARDIQDGENSTLTIDASLQFAVEHELRSAVQKHNARGGSVIVMNAVNGEILAMANQPSFNPNAGRENPEARRNRALTDGYEPGSTLKAVLLAGALANGMKLTDQLYGGDGELRVQGRRISEAEAHEKFAWLSLKKMIQVSSNVVAARLALKLGADKYWETLQSFGFGRRSGAGFPGEIPGRVPARKSWSPLSLATIGFGQGVLVTPLQMTRAYATFLNGGWLVQPRLLKTPLEGAQAQPPQRILDQKTADAVLEALRETTHEGGTAVKARLEGYEVAGKTGTAQVVDPVSKTYSRSRYIASFIGYAVGVDPKIVIFASLDEPRGVYYASETAAPLFREVLNAVAGRFGMPAKPDSARRILAQQAAPAPSPAQQAVPDDRLHISQAKVEWAGGGNGVMRWKMPQLRGLTPREALQALKGHAFEVEIRGSGLIRQQIPEPGKTLAEGDTIKLSLGE